MKFLLAIGAIALSLSSIHAQEPPLPAKSESPTPSPAGTRPELNIPEIPMSIDPPRLVPDASAPPGPLSAPAQAKKAAALSELDAAFQKSPLAQAAEEQRLHLEWRQLQNRTAHDPEVLEAKEAAAKARTDLEKRNRLRAYYNIYYAHMQALASAPEVKKYLDGQKAGALNFLNQPKVRPTPTPHPSPTPHRSPTP